MIIFDKLWKTMKEKGVSTYILRERHGFHTDTISNLRHNQNITTNTLNKLCEILDCELQEIVEYVKE